MFLTMAYLWILGLLVYLAEQLICSYGIQNVESEWAKQGRSMLSNTLVKNVLLRIWKPFTGSSQSLALGLRRNEFQVTELTLSHAIEKCASYYVPKPDNGIFTRGGRSAGI